MNDEIPMEPTSVRYMSCDCAMQMVAWCGKGALTGICDIKLAFCLLPIHPSDFTLLDFAISFKWMWHYQWTVLILALLSRSLVLFWNGCLGSTLILLMLFIIPVIC